MTSLNIKYLKNGIKVVIDQHRHNTTSVVKIGAYILGGKYTETKRTLGSYYILERVLLAKLETMHLYDTIRYDVTTTEYHTHISLTYTGGEGATSDDNVIATSLMLETITSILEYSQHREYVIDETIYKQAQLYLREELTELIDEPYTRLFERVNEIFAPKHISSIYIDNTIESIEKTTLDNINKFIKHTIIPERTMFYIAGDDIPSYSTFQPFKRRMQQIPNNIKPTFSISRLEKYSLPPQSVPGLHTTSLHGGEIYYVKTPSITTRLHFRWRIPVKLFDYKYISIVDYIIGLMRYIAHDRNVGDIKAYYDPINANLSYVSITCITRNHAHAHETTLSIIKAIDDIIEYIDDDQLNKYKKCIIDEHPVTNTKHSIDDNIANLLLDKPPIAHERILHYNRELCADDIKDFVKKYITLDKLLFIYSGPYNIF